MIHLERILIEKMKSLKSKASKLNSLEEGKNNIEKIRLSINISSVESDFLIELELKDIK